jgi:hypothetical protein
MDGRDHLERHHREPQQRARQRGARDFAALEHQGCVEFRIAAVVHVHVDAQLCTRRLQPPAVAALHRDEGGHVESLVERPAQCAAVPLGGVDAQDVAVAFLPRRVGDFRDDGLQRFAISRVAVVETHGIEAVSERTQVRQQADRAARPISCFFLHPPTHGFIERQRWIAEEIATAEFDDVAPADRPQPAPGENAIEFRKVEVREIQLVAEGMRMRAMPAVSYPAGVKGALQRHRHGQRTPSRFATATALRRPSSWKPQPQ